MSYNETRAAVLDHFFWKSESTSTSVAEAVAVPSPDPRLDHSGVKVSILSDRIGPMPPLEALCTPVHLRMDQWHDKRDEWQKAVSGALGPPMENRFLELEVTKRVALDCARAMLGTTGGRRMRLIPHHSEAVKRLKRRLTLLRVVRREIYPR